MHIDVFHPHPDTTEREKSSFLKGILKEKRRLHILAGDLNALSPEDTYEKQKLINQIKANHEKFAAMIAKAFAAAEATTDPSVPRRYLTQWRNKPVRKSEDGFVDAPILPCWGPRVREWALSESRDPDEMEVQFAAMERQERNPATKRANLAAAKAASGFKKKSVKATTGVKPSVTSGEQK